MQLQKERNMLNVTKCGKAQQIFFVYADKLYDRIALQGRAKFAILAQSQLQNFEFSPPERVIFSPLKSRGCTLDRSGPVG